MSTSFNKGLLISFRRPNPREVKRWQIARANNLATINYAIY